MTHAFIRTAAALAVATGFVCTAQATETPLDTVLGGLSNWTLVGDSNFSFASLGAGSGSTLTFALGYEATYWAATQTFSITDGSKSTTIFAGSDSAVQVKQYVVSSLFNGVKFASNSGNADQTAPGGSIADFQVYRSIANSNIYALAYEDYHVGAFNDHNDMVIGLSVSAVPEPSTYILSLAGLGLVGLLGRRGARG